MSTTKEDNKPDTPPNFAQRLQSFLDSEGSTDAETEGILEALSLVLKDSPFFKSYFHFMVSQMFSSTSWEEAENMIAAIWMSGFLVRSRVGSVEVPHERIN